MKIDNARNIVWPCVIVATAARRYWFLFLALCLASCVAPDTQHQVVISARDQKLALLDRGNVMAIYPVSTSKFGLGDWRGSSCTPLGKLEIAKKIANAVRHVGGGLRFVRAIGMRVEEKGIVQVSMNLMNYHKTPIHRALELVKIEAARYGVSVKDCDLVGMVPIEALEEVVSYYLRIAGFTSKQIIEYHIPPD